MLLYVRQFSDLGCRGLGCAAGIWGCCLRVQGIGLGDVGFSVLTD